MEDVKAAAAVFLEAAKELEGLRDQKSRRILPSNTCSFFFYYYFFFKERTAMNQGVLLLLWGKSKTFSGLK